jgi:hypothetical protein
VTTLFGSVFIIAPVVVLALVQEFRRNTEVTNEGGYHPRYLTRGNLAAVGQSADCAASLAPGRLRTAVYGVGAW